MKQIKGWWFTNSNVLGHSDGRKIKIGRTHKVKGKIAPCYNGLHLCQKPLDALKYAKGSIVYRVIGSGSIVPHGDPADKHACSERTYIAGGVDVSDILLRFACLCALDVIHLWNAPDIVIKYLKTKDETARSAARSAAGDAVRSAAWDTAGAAAWDTARSAAWDAAQAKQNQRLCGMLMRKI